MLPILLSLSLAALANPPVTDIDTVLADFTDGAATRDVARVEAALHPDARQFVFMPDGLQVIDRPTYVSLLKAGSIGGTPTTRTVQAIQVDGRRATAQQVRDLGAMSLHDSVALVETADGWRIASVVIEVVPAEAP